MKEIRPAFPFVSVIIPTYNGARFIEETLDSVRAQTYDMTRVEVVVVDDGSSDGTADLVERRGDVRCIRQANAGVAVARNRGIAETRADVVMLLDQDDLWEPEKVVLQMAYLGAHPDVGAVAGHARAFAEPGIVAYSEEVRQLMARPRPFVFPSALAIRRAILARIGMFDPTYTLGSDMEWLIRARRYGVELHVLSELVCHYRIHAANASRDLSGSQRDLLRALRAARRRDNSGTS
jgi:glycosyltransferase involved in cell wall biosynthesis